MAEDYAKIVLAVLIVSVFLAVGIDFLGEAVVPGEGGPVQECDAGQWCGSGHKAACNSACKKFNQTNGTNSEKTVACKNTCSEQFDETNPTGALGLRQCNQLCGAAGLKGNCRECKEKNSPT